MLGTTLIGYCLLYILEMHCASERGQLLTGGYTLVSVTYCLMHLLCSHFNKRKKTFIL